MGLISRWKEKKQLSGKQNVQKSRKPANTSFRQQRLKAWQPILSPQSVLPLLILMACIFAPIGIGLVVSTISVQRLVVNYTECDALAPAKDFETIPSEYVDYHFSKKVTIQPQWMVLTDPEFGNQTCRIQFEIPNHVKKSTYVYYHLTNFNQNYREYVQSLDLNQLKGKPLIGNDLDPNCDPFRTVNNKTIFPCGLIANSMFNDTFDATFTGVDGTPDYLLTTKGIAWATDRHRYGKTGYNASDIIPPPNWSKLYPNGYTNDNVPDLQNWEEFKVWMRTAALPNFYKLAMKNETNGLRMGIYVADIKLNYPVKSYNGTKSFVLTTNSIIGAGNEALGIVYLIVAGIATLFAILFLVKVIFKPRPMHDHSYLNFETEDTTPYENSVVSVPLREIL
ncbi:hypothetical protein SMKI_14G3650 [Saccharomyces mikatae IFO 1815]|uniref:Cell division control protein 50 n=1 Tax=Saccharomyces mikatae IFO 1815 TaxID=226126 RepID=A0AA35ISJ6_SACMI|nr:uncharacterized protein SMKI_14G3650 [Saccharomyces mikatae IFO 1815]CAI4036146.1 hypothetical protein SMKI_14G3650 [Saccharomyces mikatae IFO 1815]